MDEVDERTRQRLARKARRQALKRERILTAARAVLLEVGIDGLTTAAVAEAADISAPTLYYYFPSLQVLVDALTVQQLGEDVARMEAAMSAEDHPVDALVATVTAHVRHYAAHPASYFHYEGLFRAGLSETVLVEGIYPLSRRINDRLEARLRQGQLDGLVHPDVKPRQLANTAWCLAQGILFTWLGFTRSGGSMLFSIEDLLQEGCANLARGARAG